MLNFDWLAEVSLGSAKLVFLGLFLGIALLVSRLPSAFVRDGGRWTDLRLWTYGLLALTATIYCLF